MSNIASDNACRPIDCNYPQADDVQPYPDISGSGVPVGFLGTAYLVLLLAVAGYCLAFDPDKEPFEDEVTPADSTSNTGWRTNVVDKLFVTRIHKMLHLTSDTRARLRSAFDESIIMLCDVQIVTGLGILCSSYMLLHCGLHASRWQIAVYLAWFSTVTHLSGLTVLRTYLNAYRWAKYVRVVLMFILLIMLIVGLVPTGFFSKDDPASQATCYFDANYAYRRYEVEIPKSSKSYQVGRGKSWQAMVFSIVLLITSFLTRTVKLFRPLSTAFRLRVRRPLSGWTQGDIRCLGQSKTPPSRGEALKLKLVTKPALAVFLTAGLNYDLFSSMFFEVFWLVVILLWATVKLLGARNAIMSTSTDVAASENKWTFGQILPVFLLLGPLFSITGILAYHITKRPLPTSYYSGSMDHMAISDSIPLQEHHSPSRRSIESRPSSDVRRNIDRSQGDSYHASATSVRPATCSTRGEFSYLEDFSDAPWLPICVFSSFLAILAETVILFGLSFSASVLLSYRGACATTVGFGLGMDLRTAWKKTAFFWLCILVDGVAFILTFSKSIGMRVEGEWCADAAPYMALVACFLLYFCYIIFCVITV